MIILRIYSVNQEDIIDKYGSRRKGKSDFKEHKTNEEIVAKEVRLVGEEGEPRVVSLKEALDLAESRELDLVEVSGGQTPPAVKIMDYRKFRFEQMKKAKEAKKKQKVIHIKEVKVRPRIDQHDYDHKIKRARGFLEKGDKVKVTMMFRGREIVHADLGRKVMDDVRNDLADCSIVEKKPSLEGRNMIMFLAPSGAGSNKSKENSKAEGEVKKNA